MKTAVRHLLVPIVSLVFCLLWSTSGPAHAQYGYTNSQTIIPGTIQAIGSTMVTIATSQGAVNVPIVGTTFFSNSLPLPLQSLYPGLPVQAYCSAGYTPAYANNNQYVNGYNNYPSGYSNYPYAYNNYPSSYSSYPYAYNNNPCSYTTTTTRPNSWYAHHSNSGDWARIQRERRERERHEWERRNRDHQGAHNNQRDYHH